MWRLVYKSTIYQVPFLIQVTLLDQIAQSNVDFNFMASMGGPKNSVSFKSRFGLAHGCVMGVSLCNRLMASSLEKSWNRGLKVGFTAKCDVIYEPCLSCLDEALPLSANNICLFIIILNQHKYEHVLECARPYDSVILSSSRMSKALRVSISMMARGYHFGFVDLLSYYWFNSGRLVNSYSPKGCRFVEYLCTFCDLPDI